MSDRSKDIAQPQLIELENEAVEHTFAERFEKIVRMYTDRLAVKTGDRSLTYDELNKAANRVARAILDKRGPGNEPIALLFEHGADVITAIFGVMKAGKFYVALDPVFPMERNQDMLIDSGALLIITNSRNFNLANELARDNLEVLNFDEIDETRSSDNLDLVIAPTDFALMTYTSGSTGKPKAVAREQFNAMYEHRVKTSEVPIEPTDRLSLLHSVVFGSAGHCLFQSLLNGASLFPFNVKEEGVARLARWLREERITIFHSPPAVFRQVAELLFNEEKLQALRLIRLSGSAVTKEDFELYKQAFSPNTSLEIHMGSTEAGAIGRAVVDHNFTYPTEGVAVGYPPLDKKVFLLDEDGREVAPGEAGEIAIKSRRLNPGYWKQVALTKAKFIPDPEGGEEFTFLTGDLGRFLPNGFLIHLGRKDFMVKIRGYRVEIAEIEGALLTHPRLKEACVAAWDRENGEKYLAAYIVSPGHARPTVDELRRFLGEKLPDYMIPSGFVFMESLPLTNGKLDRRALPKVDARRPELSQSYAPPENEVERMLVDIWAEILSLDQVGVHDNFFDLGGHSLAATRVVSQVIKRFQLDLPLQSLFQSPTVAEMAAVINEYQEKRLPEEELEHILTELESMSDEEAQHLLAEKTQR